MNPRRIPRASPKLHSGGSSFNVSVTVLFFLVRERLSSRSLSPTVSVCCFNCVCVCLLVHVGFLVGVLVLTLVFLTLVLLVILELPVLLLPLLVFDCWLLFAYRMTYTCAHCVVRQRSLRSPHTSSPWAWDQASAVY